MKIFDPLRRWAASWERPGLHPGIERRLDALLMTLVTLFAVGWAFAVAVSVSEGRPSPLREAGGLTRNPLAPGTAPDAVYALDLALERYADMLEYRGESGAVDLVIREPGDTAPPALAPDSLPPGVEVTYRAAGDTAPTAEPAEPNVWNVLLRMRGVTRRVPDLTVATLVPFAEKRGGRIGQYVLGDWPYEQGGKPKTPAYAPPRGFIRVTPENLDQPVSEHFVLGDFLTKGQEDVWPKYVVLSPRLLDKLELTLQELEERGHPVQDVGVISGFRHPRYNVSGGNPSGRGSLSRHMYGDAADIFIDNDGDFCMDDLTGDGRATVADARVIAQAAEAVEKEYPQYIGGIGIYPPTGAHCGMVHIDTRGYRARW